MPGRRRRRRQEQVVDLRRLESDPRFGRMELESPLERRTLVHWDPTAPVGARHRIRDAESEDADWGDVPFFT